MPSTQCPDISTLKKLLKCQLDANSTQELKKHIEGCATCNTAIQQLEDDESRRVKAGADRNLLFGILALQMDFINRDQLIAAMNAWVLDKAQPLGQILCAQGALTTGNLA